VEAGTDEVFSVATPFGPSAFEKRVMTPGNRRFVRTALAILGLMALATATVWIVLFMFVRPARGDTVDARMFYVIDGDTLALAGERIRLLGIDAPETREARCERERERVAGYETKARVVDLLRFGRSVDIRRHGHDQYGRTLAHIVIDGRDLGEQLVREKLALAYRGAEAKPHEWPSGALVRKGSRTPPRKSA